MGIQGIEYGREHERLEHLLRSVDRPGEYCVGGRLFTPLPRVVVTGAGELSFPIPGAQIRSLIAAAERAPCGRGTETVVDPSVRDCWQIDAEQVRLAGRAWPRSFRKVTDLVAAGLGLPAERLDADLYKLLVYRPGGFFAEHRDTEKAPGMVATLSLSLPVPGTGGELVVRHGGRERVFDLGAREPSELSYAAFYADCLHEVRPLLEGHRVTLVFNLFLDSPDDAPGAPDHSDLAAGVAERLARWRDEGVTDKVVWLLDHEYSEGGLSFSTLKNADAAVARVLGAAADRADCEIHAAVLRIGEFGSPAYEPPGRRRGWDWEWDDYGEEDESDAEMDEVHDRWEELDGWAARDGSRPPFGRIPLNALELLPRGGLDDAEPDRRRLQGSTGNEGPTLEFIYRLAALVVWPSGKTVDIVAEASIDQAVSWVGTQSEAADGAGGGGTGRISGLLRRLTEVWPVGGDARRPEARGAMLRLLRDAGERKAAADFLRRVVLARYDGDENEALAAVLPVVGPEEAAGFLPLFVDGHLPRRFGDVIELLVLAAAECAVGGDAEDGPDPAHGSSWRKMLRDAVAAALSGPPAAFRTESERRRRVPRDSEGRPLWNRRVSSRTDRAAYDWWVGPADICGLLLLAHRFGLDEEAAAAVGAFGDHPDIATPDRTLPAALELMHRRGAPAGAPAYRVLWRRAADFLSERSSTVPVEPADWTVAAAADISCDCELCARLRAFCADPAEREERFKVRKDLRRHLHRVIDRHRLDLDHVTARSGRPYTLVCTKNRAGHERRLEEYAEDLRRMSSLLTSIPEGEGRHGTAGRAEKLEEALAAGGAGPG